MTERSGAWPSALVLDRNSLAAVLSLDSCVTVVPFPLEVVYGYWHWRFLPY